MGASLRMARAMEMLSLIHIYHERHVQALHRHARSTQESGQAGVHAAHAHGAVSYTHLAIASGACSHIGAFNTLYQVRAQISRHIAKVNLGFFDQTTSGALKKVIIEDVERIEKLDVYKRQQSDRTVHADSLHL